MYFYKHYALKDNISQASSYYCKQLSTVLPPTRYLISIKTLVEKVLMPLHDPEMSFFLIQDKIYYQ